ncbi:MAG: 2-amino-4-hydroxy-6-hydroxymethyldihydropteridine diphosphokinase [Ruminococcaceae bacterium]|nr:2-amino-4-hydroxy-6-hydroxymethyldihydropteridine diphosphokinase [Oscillospiraceae bacterium]
MSIAYLGLGANLGDAAQQLAKAVDALNHVPMLSVDAISPYYVTAPVGYLDQPDFINLCVRVSCDLSPEALLGACLGIESALGRERTFRNAPRIIDIDVLLFEGQERETEELTVPHPRLFERAFALVPLQDILSKNSMYTQAVVEALESVDKSGVRRL